jgi:hypothetical protein
LTIRAVVCSADADLACGADPHTLSRSSLKRKSFYGTNFKLIANGVQPVFSNAPTRRGVINQSECGPRVSAFKKTNKVCCTRVDVQFS